jgi:hypothetical protein
VLENVWRKTPEVGVSLFQGRRVTALDLAGKKVDPFREGVVCALSSGRVRGVLLWNTWDQVDNARALIGEPGLFQPADLVGRLPS